MKILVDIQAIVNPLGAIPVFLSLYGERSPKEANAIARVTALSVGLVLLISTRIGKRLGITGLNIATRIMGLLLSAI
ncbi:MAG TPA: antibiotic resistance protein MarC, partial [Desulfobacterales bacterium]|nr:antibiotic resistance protein MarC [Desulfobacterales bacterium]